MKVLGISLVLVGLLLAVVPAGAAGDTTFAIKSKDNGGGNYVWTSDKGDNPTLTADAGASVTITATNDDGGTHQLKVGDKTSPDTIDTKGASTSVTVTGPQSGDLTYECPLHPTTMKGTIHFGAASTDTGGKKSPGTQIVGVTIALVGAAMLISTRRGRDE